MGRYNWHNRNTNKHETTMKNHMLMNWTINLEEMDKSLEMYNHPRLNEEETGNIIKWITYNKSESVLNKKKLPANKSAGTDSFKSEFYQTFKEEFTPILLKLFQKIAESGIMGLGEKSIRLGKTKDTW